VGDVVAENETKPEEVNIVQLLQYQDKHGRSIMALCPIRMEAPPAFIGNAVFQHHMLPHPVQVQFKLPPVNTIEAAFDCFEECARQAYQQWKAEVERPRIVRPGG
jgi:hypothetical protein